MRVLIIDNHDSFVYNIAQYVGSLGAEPVVMKSTEIDLNHAKALKPERIIISPGPCAPDDSRYFGISLPLIKTLGKEVDTLGICLGHQGIAYAFGGRVVRAKKVMHGKTSKVYHDSKSVYRGINNPITAARYHSLIVDRETLPEELVITAETEEKEVMGIRHISYPIEGLQFHPESIMTEDGMKMIENFLQIGVDV